MLLNFLFFVIILAYGILIGSFLNVCIYRIPRKESIITTRSHCMDCGSVIKNKDLIPVFSYLVLRGRCRNCGSKLSLQYPLIEILNGVTYVIIFHARGVILGIGNSIVYNLISILLCLTASALIVLSMIDFRSYEIPAGINLFIFIMGLIRVGLDYRNWCLYLIGFFCVSLLLYLLYLLSKGRAIGGGDVKLMAAAGLLLGGKNIVLALILGCMIGSVVHLLRMKISHADKVLAMGPYLACGIVIAMLYGDSMWSWYLSAFL